jgi:sulfatase maturation enzyme AslB (radical SAM superfamily)
MTKELISIFDISSNMTPDNLSGVDAYITSRCNRRCTYCFLPVEYFAHDSHMTLEAFVQLLDWMSRHRLQEVTLLGGEPSLHPHFVDMISLAHDRRLNVRIVTNGAPAFQRAIAGHLLGPHNLGRVSISLDTVHQEVQDRLRGRGAWRDATNTIRLLQRHKVVFDINVTAVSSVIERLDSLIEFSVQSGCRRLNIHCPSPMGIGSSLSGSEIPEKSAWQSLVRRIVSRVETRSDFFIDIERGFLNEGEELTLCAVRSFSNLQILPDGRAYRCGLLVDRPEMSSLTMVGDKLLMSAPERGEERLRSAIADSCDACPVMEVKDRHACIADRVISRRPFNPT